MLLFANRDITVSVPRGWVLSLINPTGTTGRVIHLSDIVGSEPFAPVAIAGVNLTFGPFGTDKQYRIICDVGLITYSVAFYEPEIVTSWTPQINFGGAHANWTATSGGLIVKDGRKILVTFEISSIVKGGSPSTGLMTIDGLPYKSVNLPMSGFFFSFAFSLMQNTTGVNYYQGGIQSNSMSIVCAKLVNGTETFLNDTDFVSSSYIKGSGYYLADQA